MKLWYSFTKELKLASKSFYFYIEIVFSIIILVIVLFVIPENFKTSSTEYLYLDMPPAAQTVFIDAMLDADLDGKAEVVELQVKKETFSVDYYESDDKKIYIVGNKDDMITLADSKRQMGATIKIDETFASHYTYYLQGYETQKLRNLFLVIQNNDFKTLEAAIDSQDVRPLSEDYEILNDREHTLPSLLTFNGSFMGMFIIAAFIFLDKEQGIIKAYAVTASSVWQYLMSKTLVITIMAILTTLLIAIPVMGARPNYPLMLLFLITTGFFASSLGLLVSGFYDSMNKAFNIIYLLLILMMLPAIAYFIPSWEPFWIRFIPTYYIINGFREVIVKGGDIAFVLLSSLGFLAAGTLLFMWASYKHKRNLTA